MRNPERVWKLVLEEFCNWKAPPQEDRFIIKWDSEVGQCRGVRSDFYVVHCWLFFCIVCGLKYNFLDYCCLLTCRRERPVRETILSEILSLLGEVGFGSVQTLPGPIQCYLGLTVIILGAATRARLSPSSNLPLPSSTLIFFVIN